MSNRKLAKPGNKTPSRKNTKKKDPLLKLRLEFPEQAHWQGWLSATPFNVITTVTTGEYANSVPLQAGSIPGFFVRFQAFQEARVVGARVKILPTSSTNSGVINHWFESGDDITVPTATNTEHQTVKRLNASNISGQFLSYVPHDPAEVEWQQLLLTASTIAGNYNIFTNAAVYGAPIVVTNLALVQLDLLVQCRGLV